MKLKVAVYSDQHGCHRNTPTRAVVGDMKRDIMADHREMGGLDLLIFSGDLYERSVEQGTDDALSMVNFCEWITTFCINNDIVFLVIEGTPSHDNGQPAVIREISSGHPDIIYVDDLDIIHIDKLGLDILCLPDEYAGSPDRAWVEIEDLMLARGLDQVHFTVMHGAFEGQLPPSAPGPFHKPENFQCITMYAIYCGHVHIRKTMGKIEIPGSHNRVAHGEEHDKGHLRARVHDEFINHEFIVNPTAWTYKTIDVSGLTVEDGYEKITKGIEGLRRLSQVRLYCLTEDMALWPLKNLHGSFSHIVWKVEASDKKSIQERVVASRPTYKEIIISPDTIGDLVKEHAIDAGFDSNEVVQLLEELTHHA